MPGHRGYDRLCGGLHRPASPGHRQAQPPHRGGSGRRTGIPLRQTAIVGDRLYTDIAMGVNSGITSILVLSGETSREDLAGSAIRPDYVFEDIGALAQAL